MAKARPATVDAKLELLALKFSPPKYDGDGLLKNDAHVTMQLVQVGQRADPLAQFAALAVAGDAWVQISMLTTDYTSALGREKPVQAWKGKCELSSIDFRPPKGESELPEVHITLRTLSTELRNLMDLIELRVEMSGTKQTAARVQMQAWQENLPMDGEDGQAA